MLLFIAFLFFQIHQFAELRKVKLNLDDTQTDANIKIKRKKIENEIDLRVGTENIQSTNFFNEAYEQKNLFEKFFKSQKNLKKNFKIYQNRNLVRSRQIDQSYDLNGDYPKIFHIINENQELQLSGSQLNEGKADLAFNNYQNGIVYRHHEITVKDLIINTEILEQKFEELNQNEQDTLIKFREQIDLQKIRSFIIKDKKNIQLIRKLLQRKKTTKKVKIDSVKDLNDEKQSNRKLPLKRKKRPNPKDEKEQNKNNSSSRSGRTRSNAVTERPQNSNQKKQGNQKQNDQKQQERSNLKNRLRKRLTKNDLPSEPQSLFEKNTNFAKRNNQVKGSVIQNTGYHSVNIVFDKSLMDYHLRTITASASLLKKIFPDNKSKREAETSISQYLDNLLQRGNGVLRKYILFKDDNKKSPIKIPSAGPRCFSTPLFNPENKRMRGKPKKYDADTVIFVDIIHKANSPVLAEAAACDKNRDNQAQIGQMAINIAKINFKNLDHFSLYTNLMTVVHEVFHIFGFSPAFNVKVKKMAKDSNNDYLSKLKKLPNNVEPLIAEEHWEPSIIPNDLMVPQERIDAILSIFSLEYLENISKKIKTNKQNLQDNFLMDDINDYGELFTYKCTDKKTKSRPKFPFYCNEQEKRSRNISCDASFVYKAYCGAKLKNGCYERISMKNEICMNSEQISKNKFEVYGPDSRCFEVSLKNKQQAFCLKFTIDSSSILVHLQNNQIVTCLRSKNTENDIERNQRIQQGDLTVYCPNYEKFIGSVKMTGCKDFCNGNGFCSNGECECFDGYDTKDNCRSYLKTHEDVTLFSKFAQIN